MNREPSALCGPASARNPIPSMAQVLIQVPALGVRPRRPAAPRRRRRRLRREFRVAGSALAFALPMAWAFLTCWGGRPDAPSLPLGPSRVGAAEVQPVATITLEPALATYPQETEDPIVRPAGYLLPDDSSEGAAHAGS
jgi:hypothetical protein